MRRTAAEHGHYSDASVSARTVGSAFASGLRIHYRWHGRNDHLELSRPKRFDQFLRSSAVGYYGINTIQLAKRGYRLPPQFGVIKTEDHFPCRFDHRALDINKEAVRVRDA